MPAAALSASLSSLEVLEPEDVASAVWFAVSQPSRVGIHDVLMRPRDQLG